MPRTPIAAGRAPDCASARISSTFSVRNLAETGRESQWGWISSLWWNPGERREWRGAQLTRRVREEYRVYFDRNATQSAAKRRGSAGMHRRSNAAWVSPQAASPDPRADPGSGPDGRTGHPPEEGTHGARVGVSGPLVAAGGGTRVSAEKGEARFSRWGQSSRWRPVLPVAASPPGGCQSSRWVPVLPVGGGSGGMRRHSSPHRGTEPLGSAIGRWNPGVPWRGSGIRATLRVSDLGEQEGRKSLI